MQKGVEREREEGRWREGEEGFLEMHRSSEKSEGSALEQGRARPRNERREGGRS